MSHTDKPFIVPSNGIANMSPLEMPEDAFQDWLKCLADPRSRERWAQARAKTQQKQEELAHMVRGTADSHERLETFPEYLRRLADDCEESGNTGHAADHRASAGAIDLLAGALVGFLCIDDWNTEEIAPRALVARARAAIENIRTVGNALE